MLEDRDPTAAEQRNLLRSPLHVAYVAGVLWLVAALLFGGLQHDVLLRARPQGVHHGPARRPRHLRDRLPADRTAHQAACRPRPRRQAPGGPGLARGDRSRCIRLGPRLGGADVRPRDRRPLGARRQRSEPRPARGGGPGADGYWNVRRLPQHVHRRPGDRRADHLGAPRGLRGRPGRPRRRGPGLRRQRARPPAERVQPDGHRACASASTSATSSAAMSARTSPGRRSSGTRASAERRERSRSSSST